MLKACRHVRDSALIAMHYDLGCRPEEILSLQLKHVKKDDMGIKVNLHRSKTFTRSPRLTFSIPYVLEWMEGNPARDDPDAPFWINLNTHRSGGIKPDVHVIRVFKRLGLISEKDEELALKSARRLNPEYPGALDGPVWYIGKHICTQTPRCGSCPMEEVCPKELG